MVSTSIMHMSWTVWEIFLKFWSGFSIEIIFRRVSNMFDEMAWRSLMSSFLQIFIPLWCFFQIHAHLEFYSYNLSIVFCFLQWSLTGYFFSIYSSTTSPISIIFYFFQLAMIFGMLFSWNVRLWVVKFDFSSSKQGATFLLPSMTKFWFFWVVNHGTPSSPKLSLIFRFGAI